MIISSELFFIKKMIKKKKIVKILFQDDLSDSSESSMSDFSEDEMKDMEL